MPPFLACSLAGYRHPTCLAHLVIPLLYRSLPSSLAFLLFRCFRAQRPRKFLAVQESASSFASRFVGSFILSVSLVWGPFLGGCDFFALLGPRSLPTVVLTFRLWCFFFVVLNRYSSNFFFSPPVVVAVALPNSCASALDFFILRWDRTILGDDAAPCLFLAYWFSLPVRGPKRRPFLLRSLPDVSLSYRHLVALADLAASPFPSGAL